MNIEHHENRISERSKWYTSLGGYFFFSFFRKKIFLVNCMSMNLALGVGIVAKPAGRRYNHISKGTFNTLPDRINAAAAAAAAAANTITTIIKETRVFAIFVDFFISCRIFSICCLLHGVCFHLVRLFVNIH